MGARPPSTDDEESEGTIEFGIAALDARLAGAELSFPASGEEVVRALSNPEIPYDPRGRSVELRTVVERSGREEFDSRQELLNALHPVFEELRTSSRTGLVSWMRSLFG